MVWRETPRSLPIAATLCSQASISQAVTAGNADIDQVNAQASQTFRLYSTNSNFIDPAGQCASAAYPSYGPPPTIAHVS